jgi:fructokinase
VDTQLVRWSAAPTPCAVVHRGPDGRHDYTFDFEGTALADLTPHQLPELPRGVWAVHVGTVALALDPPAAAFEALVDREAGRRRIVLDPNVRPAVFGDASAYRGRFERLARLADVVKLSEDDAAWIWPGLAAEDVLGLLCGLGSEVVAITRAERGAIAASAAGVVDVAGVPVEVVDTVGAGDSFGAALIASLVDEGVLTPTDTKTAAVDQLGRAVSFAVAASAITCTRVGADPPTRAEVAAVAAQSRS